MHGSDTRTTTWKPLKYLQSSSDKKGAHKEQEESDKIALVVLNIPEESNVELLKTLFEKACYKMVVDGGANYIYKRFGGARDNYLPDIITGDFDSIQSEVKSFYTKKGVEIHETSDQDQTDFTKALEVLAEKLKGRKIDAVVVWGSFGGRLDHVFANIDTLYRVDSFMETNVIQVSTDTVAFLLKPGHNTIEVDSGLCCRYCGLIPVGSVCQSVTTQGLKWNLDNQRLQFGDMISTSNTLESPETTRVTVQTDRYLLWTMSILIDKLANQTCMSSPT